MLETSIAPLEVTQLEVTQRPAEPIQPEIKVVESRDSYGKFVVEPLERGFGITVGSPMRRVLLSSIEGTAITWIKVDGVLHEYSTIPHLKEEIMDFLLNVKRVRIRSVTGRPGKMRLDIRGEGRICAGDIATSSDFEIVNPELHIATLDSEDANFSVEFNVDHGKGYQPVSQSDGYPGPLVNILPVDAIFSPVRKVNYTVERTRVGHVTDYERVVLEVWTDGTTTAFDAVKKASDILVKHFFLFTNMGLEPKPGADRPLSGVSPEIYQTPIEKLELSPRTLNCLKRHHVGKVGQILDMTNEDLLKIRNFGQKSLQELLTRLKSEGMLTEEEWAYRMPDSNRQDGTEQSENEQDNTASSPEDTHEGTKEEQEGSQ